MKEQIMSQGKSLEEFRATKPKDLFETPTTLPAFFEENLKDDARVIKIFSNDPQANLRIFYYQYLKLCFEFDHNRYQEYINKIQQIVLDNNFQFCFPQNNDPSIYNNIQFKRLILEFLDFMTQSGMIAQKTLNNFPFMDVVFCAFFRTLLIDGQKAQTYDQYVDRTTIYEFLSGMFDVEIISYGDCMKFVETDIFSYQQQPTEVFLVYIDYEKNSSPIDKEITNQSYQESLIDNNNQESQQNQPQNTSQAIGILNNSSNTYSSNNQQNNHAKTTYIAQSGIYQFQDFTNAANYQNQPFTQQPKEQKKAQNIFDSLVKNDSKKTLQEKFKEKTNGNQDKSFECIGESQETGNNKEILGKQSFDDYKTPGQTTMTMEDSQKPVFQPFEQIQLQIPPTQSYEKNFNSSYSYSNQYKTNFTTPYVNSFSNTFTPQSKAFTSQNQPHYFPKNNLTYDSYEASAQKTNTTEKKGPKHLRRLSQQFTHSPVLEQVSQPYQSFIVGMIKRARQQRIRQSNIN